MGTSCPKASGWRQSAETRRVWAFGKVNCGTYRGLLGILPVFRSLRGRGSALAPSTLQTPVRPGGGWAGACNRHAPCRHTGRGALRQAHAHPLKLGAPGRISGAWTRVSQNWHQVLQGNACALGGARRHLLSRKPPSGQAPGLVCLAEDLHIRGKSHLQGQLFVLSLPVCVRARVHSRRAHTVLD